VCYEWGQSVPPPVRVFQITSAVTGRSAGLCSLGDLIKEALTLLFDATKCSARLKVFTLLSAQVFPSSAQAFLQILIIVFYYRARPDRAKPPAHLSRSILLIMSQDEGEKRGEVPSQQEQKEEDEKSSGTYKAGCHCGYIKFSVTLTPPLRQTKVLNCNCSACTRFGYLLVCELLSLPFPFLPKSLERVKP
jgi:hypothetical protein